MKTLKVFLLSILFCLLTPLAKGQVMAWIQFSYGSPCTFSVYFTTQVNGGIPPYTYSWDFGDGTTSTLSSFTKHYSSAGTYAVRLTVTDSTSISTANLTITVPGAEASVYNGTCGISCDGNIYYDTTASIYTYLWST